eukprot:521322_1
MRKLLIILTCFIQLNHTLQDIYNSTNIFWGNYYRPEWAEYLQYVTDSISNQVKSVSGYVVPVSSRGRGNIPLVYNGHLSLSNRERGHLMSLSNGGADIELNVIPLPSEWQTTGGWAELQATIHNFTVLTYVNCAPNSHWNACMCHSAYTVQTVFHTIKPQFRVGFAINIAGYNQHGYPEHFYGFINGTQKYHFNITINETVKWHPKPPVGIPHCKYTYDASRCCDRWNCCEQKPIQQIFSADPNVSSTVFYEGDYLESNNGLYEMTLEETGNFSIYNKSGKLIWRSNSGAGIEYHPYKLLLLSNGALQLRNSAKIFWQTQGCDSLRAPFRFIMEDNSNLVYYSFGNIPCWSSNISMIGSFDDKKDFICSSNLLYNNGVNNSSYFLHNQSCVAEILTDGQFVVKDLTKPADNDIVWSTNTANTVIPPYVVSVQMDGRLVLSGNDNFMWGVNGSFVFNVSTMENFMLALQRQQDGCMLMLYSNNMSAIWTSRN